MTLRATAATLACALLLLSSCAHRSARGARAGDDVISAYDGGAVYMRSCATCHGVRGNGVAGVASGLRLGRQLDGPAALAVIARGSHHQSAAMPAWCSTLSDRAIADVIAYIRITWGAHGGPPTLREVRAACHGGART